MRSEPPISLAWRPRAAPLTARAACGHGAVAQALGRRLLTLDDDALAPLTAVAHDRVLIVLADAAALPWVEGVGYLGRDDAAPELLLPTAQAPTIGPDLLAIALTAWLSRAGRVPNLPLAVLPAPAMVVACGGARAIERDRLAAWLARTSDQAPA